MICWSHFGSREHRGQFSISMRILIVGGIGFIGGRLAEHLFKIGHEIILGGRNLRNSPDWLPQAEVTRIEWNDESALQHSCDGVDVIIHAAGMNAQECAANPVAALAINGLATARLVAAASRAKVKKIIYFSTAHVYASPLIGKFDEESCPRNTHPYASSHLAGENAVLDATKRGEIDGVVIRLSNAFGVPVHEHINCWKLLVNDLCRQAVEFNKCTLNTNGLEERDFISLTEVSRIVECLLYANVNHSEGIIFNLGTGESKTVLTMATLIQRRCAEFLGFEPELKYKNEGKIETLPSLIYGVGHLSKFGIKPSILSDIPEIDELLHFCQSTFSKGRP